MLEKEKAIDAVLIATPDHLHAYASILAMKAGKHVYCEKPLTHNVGEARAVARVAAETGVATQMGNQGRSGEGHRQTAEWIWDGAIGAVREVHAWSGTMGPGSWTAPPEAHRGAPGAELGPVARPPHPAPYHAAYTPCTWRSFWAFGGGTLPDMGVHNLDPAFNALDLDTPETVEATATGIDAEICREGVLVTWRFGARGKRGRSPSTGTTGSAAADAGRDRSRRPEAAARRGRRRHPVRRRARPHDLRRLVRNAPPPAARAAPRVRPACEDAPACRGPSRRLAPGLQGRASGVQPLRIRRAPHGARPARQRGPARAQAPEVGRTGHEGDERTRGGAVPPRILPGRLGDPT